jgi:hypothetical protein
MLRTRRLSRSWGNCCHSCKIVVLNSLSQHFLQQEAVQTIPCPAMSPDMNPIGHVLDFIGRKINQRNPKCQNIDELRTTTRGASTLSRYFWPVRLPSRTYKSNLQSKEKQPQTVTPPLPNAVVPKM